MFLRVFRRTDQCAGVSRYLSSSAIAASQHGRTNEKCDVPAGHQNSDLRKSVCHIGLNRRRDLSLREALCLFRPGSKATVKEVFGVRFRSLTLSARSFLRIPTTLPPAGMLGSSVWCARHGPCLLRKACAKLPQQCASCGRKPKALGHIPEYMLLANPKHQSLCQPAD